MIRYIFFFVLFAARILFPQESIRFDHLSIEDGLSQSIVPCIIQDSKGFMWFGTEDGLNKYDGYNFSVLRPVPGSTNSLGHNNILSIYEDRDRVLWVGTFFGGVSALDQKTGRFSNYRNNPSDPKSLSNNMVIVIYEDRKGILWFGTNSGLNRFDRNTKEFKVYYHNPENSQSLSNNIVRSICEDSSGKLWIGTDDGLNRFDRETGIFTCFQSQTGPGSMKILATYNDRSGIVWIGTDGAGLSQFDPKTNQFKSYRNHPQDPNGIGAVRVNCIYEDFNKNLWIGTSEGLNKFDRKTGKFQWYQTVPDDPTSLSNNDVRSIYEDKSGVFWIGTYGEGINKFDGKKKQFIHHTPKNLSNKIVWSIYEDKNGILWIGTQDGLDKFDRQKDQVIHYRVIPGDKTSLSFNIVRKIFEDRYGNLWIGTNGGGLNRFDKEKGTFTHYMNIPHNPNSLSFNQLLDIYEDKSGVLWIGTYGGGLNKYNREADNFTQYKNDPSDPSSLSNNFVRCMFEDNQGNFWIGTQGGGLDKFDRKSGKFTHSKYDPGNPDSLSYDYVFAICEDRSGTLWIGTYGGGLNRVDNRKNVTFTHFGTADGLISNSIYSILEDKKEGNLWISANGGLSKFNPKEKKEKQFKNYTERDGLQSNEFNGGSCFLSRSGEMFFGGINGFNSFFPDQIKDSGFIPPIVITSFQKRNEEVKLDKPITEIKEIVISPNDYVFSFEFAALDYTAPQKNQYKYKMEGIDRDWVSTDSKKRFTAYTNLDPDTYTFRVIGSNSDGTWNEEGVSIKIIVTPDFYETWWFKTLIGMLLIFIILRLHRMRTTRIKQMMEKNRLENELKLKADFTAMLVHDLRSPLTAVMGYSDMLKTNSAQLNVPKIGNVLYRSSENMLHLINDMLDFSKFEAGEMKLYKKNVSIVNIITDMLEIMSPIFIKKKITLDYKIDPEVKKNKYLLDPDKIGQVLNNLLSNAAKFTSNKGTVIIEACIENRFIKISVTDDGLGVPFDRQKYLFNKYAQMESNLPEKGTGLGLAVSKMIIESHGGTIGYRPGIDGKGSSFYFLLPQHKG